MARTVQADRSGRGPVAAGCVWLHAFRSLLRSVWQAVTEANRRLRVAVRVPFLPLLPAMPEWGRGPEGDAQIPNSRSPDSRFGRESGIPSPGPGADSRFRAK